MGGAAKTYKWILRAFNCFVLLLAIGLGVWLPILEPQANVRSVLLVATAVIIIGYAVLYPKSIGIEGQFYRPTKNEAALLTALILVFFLVSVVAGFVSAVNMKSRLMAALIVIASIILTAGAIHIICAHYFRALVSSKDEKP